ncbi:esterase-like activity of phytase family protein [Devosia sp. 1566]|uniref:esterase-like activity of phytase family protein n=1 Tax=Devosia sp. 1566 TaxID=2499144 RepID=UPI000FDC8AC6|nr:esterase-like activity of phytase family protein [Devosia sp. 1566]
MRAGLALLLGPLLLACSPGQAAESTTVGAVQIAQFGNSALDQPAGKLIWRGGIALVSQHDDFGGLSGVTFTSPDHRVVFVSDRGQFVSGQLAYDDHNRLLGLLGVQVAPMQNSSGAPLPRQYARDAESVETVHRDGVPVAVRVSFEHLTRVADFALTDGIPDGPAREVTIPPWLSDNRSNETLESVCIAPTSSPVAGSTLLITEAIMDEAGNHRAELLGQTDKGSLSLVPSPGRVPTDCAFLPNGDLLVLERGIAFIAFTMGLRRIPAELVRPGSVMQGEVILEASGGTIDNMEALAVHTAPDGETRILIGSDNNFNDWQRTLLLEFGVPE